MKLKRVGSLLLILCCVGSVSLTAEAATVKSERRFDFTFDVIVKNLPSSARDVRIWIPVATSNSHQTVRIVKLVTSVPTRMTRDPSFGNQILYAEIHHPRSPHAEFKVAYRVTRYEYSRGNYHTLRNEEDPGAAPASVLRYLQPDRLVQTTGLIAQVSEETTRNQNDALDKAYALYNYVFEHMRYDKSGTGWGRGDAVWACDTRRGNCTDFHSLFIGLARAARIPARFDIGFPLPSSSVESGEIPGYHCWAEFYVEGLGWIPVDISEAWLDPSMHNFYFGSLDANRVEFSTGRDIVLSPRQSGGPLNYFVYPYVEVDGKPFTTIVKRFSFRDQ
ncbi:MAG: transglutaminase-like domain-containing protein [Terriglobia bacterium]